MSGDLAWRALARGELAELLGGAEQVASQAVGGATVYRLATDGRELLAVALPDGAAVVVERAAPTIKRRRIDK